MAKKRRDRPDEEELEELQPEPEPSDNGPSSKVLEKLLGTLDAIPPLFSRGMNTAFRVLMGGSQTERSVRNLQPIVDLVSEYGVEMKGLSDADLNAKSQELRRRLAAGETVDDILPEAFAAVREASARTIGLRHYDVQIIGGIVLHQGRIAEMVTGEGKTLVATLPAYLNALTGHPVHIVTVNDYLAKRDRDWMGPVYEMLGLTCGVIQSEQRDWGPEKRAAYECNIIYGTNSEFGFDYLRKNMQSRLEDQVQGELYYAIVDEVDSILIDEARVPLIISGSTGVDSAKTYAVVKRIVDELKPGVDYTVKEKDKTVALTEVGLNAIEEAAHRGIYESENIEWPHYVEQAIRARDLYRKDRDYVVSNGEVIIVDEFTGRLQHGRRWSDWLHEAIEAKEGLRVRDEQRTMATITYQNFFRLYKKLAGMTGTAITQAEEFARIYHLDVVQIPTHMPLRRVTFPDLIYRTEEEKWQAIVEEIVRYHDGGRPVLVGTTSVEKSAHLSERLALAGIAHEVLNAKNHAREAEIIALAGQKAAVTVSTNMAGRGTDIMLGSGVVHCRGLGPEDPKLPAHCLRYRAADRRDRDVCCGLHVIGTERHEARRIDDQLRGRAGRQGDPGSSRFFLSLEDDLMRLFMGGWTRSFLQRQGMPEGQPIESGMVTRAIQRAQQKVEERNFEMRKQILEYDELMDQRRKDIYGDRQKLVEGGSHESVERLVDRLLARHIAPRWTQATKEELVTRRTYRPLADLMESFGVTLTEAEWAGHRRAQLHALLAQRAQSPAVAESSKRALPAWLEKAVGHLAPAETFPTQWDYDLLAAFGSALGLTQTPEDLRAMLFRPLIAAVVDAAVRAWESRTTEDLVKTWAVRVAEMDAVILGPSEGWDVQTIIDYTTAMGLGFLTSELSAHVQHRDRLAELLAERVLQAPWSADRAELVRRLVSAPMWPYLSGALIQQRPTFEHLALWVEHRFGLQVEPGLLREAAAAGPAAFVEEALKARPAAWVRGEDLGSMITLVVDEALRADASAPDRDLAGLIAEHPDLHRLMALDPFELSKLSHAELREFLLSLFEHLATRSHDPVAVEPHLLESLEHAIEIKLDKAIPEKTLEALADECFSDLSSWAGKLGLSIERDEWLALNYEELIHHFATQAIEAWREDPVEKCIRTAFTNAFEEKVSSPGYADRASYSELVSWGATWISEPQAATAHSEEAEHMDDERRRALDTKIRTRRQSLVEQTRDAEKELVGHVEKRRKELRDTLHQQLSARVTEMTDDVKAQVEWLSDLALGAFEKAAGSVEDVRFDQLAQWLKEHFRIYAKAAELEEAAFAPESSMKKYVLEKMQAMYARRDCQPLVAATTDAVLAVYANTKECLFRWDLEKLEQWSEEAGLDFSADAVAGQFREAVEGYFLAAAVARHKEAARQSVVFDVVRSALSSFLNVSLASESRDVNQLANEVGREIQLFGVAVALERHRQLRRSLQASQQPAVAEEEAEGFSERRLVRLATCAPRYELNPIELSKHSGDELRELLFAESRRLFTETRNLLPQQIHEFWGESLLARCRMLLIHTIDERWVEYVHAMDALKEGIGFRGYAGVDPKVAYKKEGGAMFMVMVKEAKETFARQFGLSLRGALEGVTSRVGQVYANLQVRQQQAASAYQQPTANPAQPAGPGGRGEPKTAPIRMERVPGRNDPCPCGAKDKDGRPIKYKKCHGRSG